MKIFNTLLLVGISTVSHMPSLSASTPIKEIDEIELSRGETKDSENIKKHIYTREELLNLRESPLSKVPLEENALPKELHCLLK